MKILPRIFRWTAWCFPPWSCHLGRQSSCSVNRHIYATLTSPAVEFRICIRYIISCLHYEKTVSGRPWGWSLGGKVYSGYGLESCSFVFMSVSSFGDVWSKYHESIVNGYTHSLLNVQGWILYSFISKKLVILYESFILRILSNFSPSVDLS